MKKRLFPVPLILMIPLVLLVLVIGAGIYRFSLSDDEIASQFSTSTAEPDLIARQLFGINSPNPVTLTVPETRTFAVMTQHSESDGYVSGSYDDGVERGTLALDTRFVRSVNLEAQDLAFVVITVVSNQGSGRFY